MPPETPELFVGASWRGLINLLFNSEVEKLRHSRYGLGCK